MMMIQCHQSRAGGLRHVAEFRGKNPDGAALRRPKIWHGGFADEAQVAFAEFRRGRLVIHQAAADDHDARIKSHHEIGDVPAHDTRLKIKDLQCQRVALLGAGAKRQDFFLDGRGGRGEFVSGMFFEHFGEQLRWAKNQEALLQHLYDHAEFERERILLNPTVSTATVATEGVATPVVSENDAYGLTNSKPVNHHGF